MEPRLSGSAIIEFPNELEVVITRDFAAPIQLVFDAFTKAEHVRVTCAPQGEKVTMCSFDLRVGGDYHYIFVTSDGTEFCFHGTFLEVEAPTRTRQTWRFDGWPDVKAIETIELREVQGRTRLTYTLSFEDPFSRGHLSTFDGHLANFDNLDTYLRSLLER